MTMDVPRTGPCAPWIAASDIISDPRLSSVEVDPTTAAAMATVASDVLYALSARQFTGNCGPVTVRPISRPTDIDQRFGNRNTPSGYMSMGNAATAYGAPGSGAFNSYGTSKPSEVELGAYPVTEIVLVKIDGVTIPADEYYLQNRRVLVRSMPTMDTNATERNGWPVNQILSLPDDQEGTFSVTYLYGVPPPALGVVACKALAVQLTLNALDQENSLPQRVTSMTRQGVTTAVVDVMDFFQRGLTGIYEVDLFVETYNPTKSRGRTQIFSPDTGRPRRMPASGVPTT